MTYNNIKIPLHLRIGLGILLSTERVKHFRVIPERDQPCDIENKNGIYINVIAKKNVS